MSTQRAIKSQDAESANLRRPATKKSSRRTTKLANIETLETAAVEELDEELDTAAAPVEAAVDVALADTAADVAGKIPPLSEIDEANVKLFREDPILDRRIIEGMLKDRNAFLEEMAREGFAAAAVLRRAAELGLSEALIRQVKGVAADLAGERPGRRPAPSSLGARTCLSCDRVFLSSGPGNRLCMRCRGGDAGLAQL